MAQNLFSPGRQNHSFSNIRSAKVISRLARANQEISCLRRTETFTPSSVQMLHERPITLFPTVSYDNIKFHCKSIQALLICRKILSPPKHES